MTMNENDRLVLRDALIRVFADPAVADIAMEAMPPIDYSSFARLSDIENLRLHMDARFAGVDARFAAVDARFDAMDAKFGALQLSVEGMIDSKLSAQMRLMFLMQLGTIAAVTGIVQASV